jgi:hypothetical protein
MNETTPVGSLLVRPAVYRIRVHGRLDPRWSARLGGMAIAIREAPGQPTVTELTGSLPDQAALLGVLNQLYLHLVPLLSVECLSVGGRSPASTPS